MTHTQWPSRSRSKLVKDRCSGTRPHASSCPTPLQRPGEPPGYSLAPDHTTFFPHPSLDALGRSRLPCTSTHSRRCKSVVTTLRRSRDERWWLVAGRGCSPPAIGIPGHGWVSERAERGKKDAQALSMPARRFQRDHLSAGHFVKWRASG